MKSLVISLFCIVVSACVGDECYEDSQCLSGSCTWGTCDSVIIEAIFDELDDDDDADDEYGETGNSAPECVPVECDYLRENACAETIGCGFSGICWGQYLLDDSCCDPSDFGCYVSDDEPQCPACVLLSKDECKDPCEFFFLSCTTEYPSCLGRTEEQCLPDAGCEFVY